MKSEEAIEKARRYLDLVEIWNAEGFDDDTRSEMDEFWELAKLFPELHNMCK